MPPRTLSALTGTAVACALLLAGCGQPRDKEVDALDRELVGNAAGDQTDPALTSALEDQIMVDPALAQQRNGAAARPGATPGQSPIPATAPAAPPAAADKGMMRAPAPTPGNVPGGLTLGELAQSQAAGKAAANGACYRSLRYGAGWAQRLPAELPLYPDAQVAEAAGADTAGCDVRVVSFVSGAAVDRLVDFYYTHARRAGFAAEHQSAGAERILAGDKGAAAFVVTFRSHQGGGTEVDLLANHGR